MAERDVAVDRSTVYLWVQKFGPKLTKPAEKHVRRASVDWHVDETEIRVGSRWRNTLIESDHADMKRLLGYRQSSGSWRSA